jgi:hypothetical protein
MKTWIAILFTGGLLTICVFAAGCSSPKWRIQQAQWNFRTWALKSAADAPYWLPLTMTNVPNQNVSH